MNRAKIEWVKNPDGTQGFTWNPITGCFNGCEYCYARKLANTRLRERYLANHNIVPYDSEEAYMRYKTDPFYPRFWEDRLIKLDRHNISKAIGVFVCDMSDLFGIGIPEEWTRRVLGCIEEQLMREYPDRFYLLTKQPQNLIKFSPFPDNCWVGVTATDVAMADIALRNLYDIKANIKFLSLEPLLSWQHSIPISFPSHLNWVIIGSQSKPAVYAKEEWIQEIEVACDKARIPIFEKDNLRKVWYNYPKQETPLEG